MVMRRHTRRTASRLPEQRHGADLLLVESDIKNENHPARIHRLSDAAIPGARGGEGQAVHCRTHWHVDDTGHGPGRDTARTRRRHGPGNERAHVVDDARSIRGRGDESWWSTRN